MQLLRKIGLIKDEISFKEFEEHVANLFKTYGQVSLAKQGPYNFRNEKGNLQLEVDKKKVVMRVRNEDVLLNMFEWQPFFKDLKDLTEYQVRRKETFLYLIWRQLMNLTRSSLDKKELQLVAGSKSLYRILNQGYRDFQEINQIQPQILGEQAEQTHLYDNLLKRETIQNRISDLTQHIRDLEKLERTELQIKQLEESNCVLMESKGRLFTRLQDLFKEQQKLKGELQTHSVQLQNIRKRDVKRDQFNRLKIQNQKISKNLEHFDINLHLHNQLQNLAKLQVSLNQLKNQFQKHKQIFRPLESIFKQLGLNGTLLQNLDCLAAIINDM